MDFDPGPGLDTTFDVSVAAGDPFRLSLAWAEPMFGVTTDFDLYTFNPSPGGALSLQAQEDNISSQDPTEFGSFTVGGAGTRSIVIRRFAGTGTPRLKFVSNDNGANTFQSTQAVTAPDVQGPTIYGHNGAASAQTVAAVPFSNANAIEGFSSRGPVTFLFGPVVGATPAAPLGSPQAPQKPDVSATDGGINTFFGPGNRFFGTSAAAPHAAAVGALQLAENPAQSLAQLRSDQRVTAIPVGGFGPDAAGAGLVQATGALAAATSPFPTVSITSGTGLTKDATPAIGFATSSDTLAASCAIDGGAGTPCTSPFSPASPLADGVHTVQVTATAAFEHSASTTGSVEVDTKKPKLKVKGPNKETGKNKAKFKIKTEAGAKLKCKLDVKKRKKCSKKPKFNVGEGKHKLKVEATDAAGNKAKVAYRWTVV
jgi:hypothetical protein